MKFRNIVFHCCIKQPDFWMGQKDLSVTHIETIMHRQVKATFFLRRNWCGNHLQRRHVTNANTQHSLYLFYYIVWFKNTNQKLSLKTRPPSVAGGLWPVPVCIVGPHSQWALCRLCLSCGPWQTSLNVPLTSLDREKTKFTRYRHFMFPVFMFPVLKINQREII